MAKAISEVIERHAIDRRFYSMPGRTDVQVNILRVGRGNYQCKPKLDIGNLLSYPIVASACHVTQDQAVLGAAIEAAERQHLGHWCQCCCRGDKVSMAEVVLDSTAIPKALGLYLTSRHLRYVVSWSTRASDFPALVCIAIDLTRGVFYAASAAAVLCADTINHVLLDCAKMLLMEDYASSCGKDLIYGHSIRRLPHSIMSGIKRRLPDFQPDEFYNEGLSTSFDGMVHTTLLTVSSDLHVVSVRTRKLPVLPNLYDCFQ